MIDNICQVAIFVLSPLSMIMVGRKNKWGFVVGLASSPFWLWTTYSHDQWGMFLNSVFYTGIWIYGIYQWFKKIPPSTKAAED